ncbi:MAG: hypothetical protein E6G97_18385 [Alphaproteobacteria bacterium]|nr:MAG: hypothetical protein E6G97_18385 [Alphaproteobacteria bacterium]
MKKIICALFAIALVVLFAMVAPHSGPVFRAPIQFDIKVVSVEHTHRLTQEEAGGWDKKSQAAKEQTWRVVDQLTDELVAEYGRDTLSKIKAAIIIEVEGEAAGNEAARELTERARKRLKETLTP